MGDDMDSEDGYGQVTLGGGGATEDGYGYSDESDDDDLSEGRGTPPRAAKKVKHAPSPVDDEDEEALALRLLQG